MTKKGPIVSLVVLLAAFCGSVAAQAATYTLALTANHGSATITPDEAQYDECDTVEPSV
jgi:hypothetical protein